MEFLNVADSLGSPKKSVHICSASSGIKALHAKMFVGYVRTTQENLLELLEAFCRIWR